MDLFLKIKKKRGLSKKFAAQYMINDIARLFFSVAPSNDYLKFKNCTSTDKSASRTAAIICCKSSRLFPVTRI